MCNHEKGQEVSVLAREANKVQWLQAWRIIRAMKQDPAQTQLIFELQAALDGGDIERQYQAFCAEQGAAELLKSKPELVERLSQFERLQALPANTLGYAYWRLMDSNKLSANGLEEAAREVAAFTRLYPDADRAWFAKRTHCVHDLLHVLTGYGQDAAGEATLLAFYDGNNSQRFVNRTVRFGMVSSLFSAPITSWWRTFRFMRQAWRRGAGANIPFTFAWEVALEQPLSDVRYQLSTLETRVAHPYGILQGQLNTAWCLTDKQLRDSATQ